MVIAFFRVLITLLISTREPSSRGFSERLGTNKENT